jgi:hypothetical protein
MPEGVDASISGTKAAMSDGPSAPVPSASTTAHPQRLVMTGAVAATLFSILAWSGFWFALDSSEWLFWLGVVGLLVSPLVLQIQAGIAALRTHTSAASAVLRMTFGFWSAGTAVYAAMALIALIVNGDLAPRDIGAIPRFGVRMLGYLWAYAVISGCVVVAVVELVGRTSRGGGLHAHRHGAGQ